MAPTRMKLRVRRRDNGAGGSGAGAGGGRGQGEEEEERNRVSGGRKKTAAAASSSPTSSASVRAASAEEASPDSKCPICLDRFNNLAYLDRCLHRFCFPCIQEWSHNKAECPLCKQPFSSILHSVRAEDDFKEYTLRPAPANSSVAATVAMVAAMATAVRSDHEMRLMLRRRRGGGGETTTARRRRERGGRGGGGRGRERRRAGEWYLAPPLPRHPAFSGVAAAEDEEREEEGERGMRAGGEELMERGVIFDGLTGLWGAVAPVAPNDRSSRRLMTRLAARHRLQREGGTVRRLREREMLAFRRALYRSGTRVSGIAGANGSGNEGQQRNITAESYRRNATHLNRLRPWLRRELTVLYGAHLSLVDIVQRIITARLARHGLEDAPTIEEELRPFLLARTDHFLHELVSFARSPLSLENYDLQAVYEPPDTAMELDAQSSSTDDDSVIAISEGEEGGGGGRSEERQFGRADEVLDDLIQTGSSLSLSAWDDETPGPSYSTVEPSHSPALLPVTPLRPDGANQEAEEGERREEEECLIVGYVKPMAERTPELVQLSSDTEEEEKEEEKKDDRTTTTIPPLSSIVPSISPSLASLPIIPPSTSNAEGEERQTEGLTEKENDAEWHGSQPRACSRSRARSRSSSDGSRSEQNSVCVFSPVSPGEMEGWRETETWKEKDQRRPRYPESTSCQAAQERRRKRRKRSGEREGGRQRKGRGGDSERVGSLRNPNLSIYPAMFCRSEYRHSRSPSLFHCSSDSRSQSPPSPLDSSWEYRRSRPSSSSSSSSPSSVSFPLPPLSPGVHSNPHHGDKPGGKRKYKSRHLDDDPTWKPASGCPGDKRAERGEKKWGRDGGKRRERGRRDGENNVHGGESSRRCREGRSPSVEIIYEGTIAPAAPRPPASKRRRKRHRKAQHSSSPVIITIDSDSSHDDVNNSSPLNNQRPIDFSVSDLPPIPLVDSGDVGGDLDSDISELPDDILERVSDRSENELDNKSKASDPIAVVDSDDDVDVENDDDGGGVSGHDDSNDNNGVIDCNKATPANSEHRPVRKPVTITTAAVNQCFMDVTTCGEAAVAERGSRPMGESDTGLGLRGRNILPDGEKVTEVEKNESGVVTSDTRLLATILNDLKGIVEAKPDLSLTFEPKLSPDPRKGHLRAHCDLNPSSQHALPEDCLNDRSYRRASSPAPLPHLQRMKEWRVGDGPPLLKYASTVSSSNRNTPPPLKHKDAGSPRPSPVDSGLGVVVSSTDSGSAGVIPPVDHSTAAVSPVDSCCVGDDWDCALASAGAASTVDPPSSLHLAPTDLHSTGHTSPIDSHSSGSGSKNRSAGAAGLPPIDFHSLPPTEVHSNRRAPPTVDANEVLAVPSSPRTASPIELHPVKSASSIERRSFRAGSSSATSRLSRKEAGAAASRRRPPVDCSAGLESPVDLHPSSGVSSGVGSNVLSPPPVDTRRRKPSPSEFLCSSEAIREKPSDGSTVKLAPIDLHPTSPDSPIDFQSSSAVTTIEGNYNSTSLSPSSPTDHHAARQTTHTEPGQKYRPTTDSHSKPQFPTDSHSKPQYLIDSHSKASLTDSRLFPHTHNHVQPIDVQWDSHSSIDTPSNTRSPIDERWNTHTHSGM